MIDKVIHQRYRGLAAAAIMQGVNDWLQDKKASAYSLYRWIEECDYFDYLGIDREYFYVKVLNMKKNKVRRVNIRNNGKKQNV